MAASQWHGDFLFAVSSLSPIQHAPAPSGPTPRHYPKTPPPAGRPIAWWQQSPGICRGGTVQPSSAKATLSPSLARHKTQSYQSRDAHGKQNKTQSAEIEAPTRSAEIEAYATGTEDKQKLTAGRLQCRNSARATLSPSPKRRSYQNPHAIETKNSHRGRERGLPSPTSRRHRRTRGGRRTPRRKADRRRPNARVGHALPIIKRIKTTQSSPSPQASTTSPRSSCRVWRSGRCASRCPAPAYLRAL